jgi:hypothetical protein
MIGALKWFRKEEESRESRLDRIANELRTMTEEDRKMFFHRVYGNGNHVHKNPPGKKGPRGPRQGTFQEVVLSEIDGRKRMDAEDIRKEGSHVE